MTISTWWFDARQDAAVAVRMLARRPGFAAVAILTLALGIGAPTAIFSVVNGVLLKPLPYPDPDRVVAFRIESETPVGPFKFDALPVTEALEWGAGSRTLSTIAVFNDRALTLTTAEGPFRLSGISSTPNLFDVLGSSPAIGRVFAGGEVDVRQVVLSDATWRRFFASDPTVVGRMAVFDGEPYRVSGVMPAGFGFPTPEAAFWVPQIIKAGGSRGMVLPAIGRLASGATLAAVVEEGSRFVGRSDDPRVKQTLIARTLREQMVGSTRRVLWVLMAAVSLVSVIATVNIALLLLTRGASRSREFSIRLALGAGRERLMRQLVVEGVILALLGGVAGLVLAGGALRLLLQLAPANLPRLHEASIDQAVLLFAAAVTLASTLVFGVLSAGRMVALDAVRRLTGAATESRLVVSGPARHQLNALAVVELALTMVLLVGAGLLLRSFVALMLVPQGFDATGSIAFGVNLPAARYAGAEARLAFLDRLADAARHLAGVQHVGLAAEMPNRQPTGRFEFSATGVELFADPMTRRTVETRMVGEGFIEAMGIPVRAGRTFTAADTAGTEAVIVISELFARQSFGDRPAVGQMLYSGSGDRRVIGVVGDVRPAAEDAEMVGAVYLPLRQQADLLSWHSGMNVVVRASRQQDMKASLRALVLSLDPALPPSNMRLLQDEVSALVAGPRFVATVLAVFALIALVMASLGVYGVMAFAVGRRTREIGVRMALGASRRQLLQSMMRDGIVVVAAGLLCGLTLAIWLARGLTGLLYEVTPADPASVAAVAALLGLAALLAVALPAYRATRTNLLVALRDD